MALQFEPPTNGAAVDGPQSVVDQVTDAILGRIVRGELPPGEQVAIRDLATSLNVSHVPVRESLRRLESRGLVIFHRGRRPQIAPVDIDDFDAIYRLRKLLEVAVASRLEGRLTDDRLAEVERCMEEFRATMERDGSLLATHSLHSRLHLALLPAASRWDQLILHQLWDATERYLQLFLARKRDRPEAVERIITVHQHLVDVAREADAKKLAKSIGSHVDVSIESVRPVIAEFEQGRGTEPS